MGESSSSRHGKVRAATLLALSGVVIAACSPVPGEPAPVYMMGGTAARERAPSAPIQRVMGPVALAPSPRPSTSVRQTPRAAPTAAASLSPSAAPPPVGVRTEAETAQAEPAQATSPHGSHFSWPLNGRVLAGYGAVTGGGHNDGINIAAPRGTPIVAMEGGTVAYAGNELRGYGNLILIKHAEGWISAYGHCDELLVKKGDQVHRGTVIAKVGATGNVNEPQLHFELRRGKQPVDPRRFLATAPVATNARGPERQQ
jgi:murein DD-endopeptidase MepM/ murein hydrolase activator NlpD